MAKKDVNRYYSVLTKQYTQAKEDLEDFSKALRDGHITEDQLADIKEDTAHIKENFDRITYIMYLLNLPNKEEKKDTKSIKHDQLYYNRMLVDLLSVKDENERYLDKMKQDIENLKAKIKE